MSQSIMTDQFPSEWQTMRIGDLFQAKAGGDYDPSNSSDVRDNRYPYPIYANGLTQQGLYGFSNYAEEPSGSITVTGRGTLGQAFYRDTPFVAIGRLIVLKPKTSIDARFFSEYINYGIEFAVESTGVPQLTAPQISNYLILVPPEPEQHAIAEALSDVDGLLNALEALIAKKQAIKQAVMQRLLTGKTRLPGFSGGWETKRLGEIAPIRNHKTLPAYVNPNTLCVELDHIEQRSGQLLEYAMARNSTSSKYHFCAGDVLFGRLRPYLRKFWHADRDGICTTEIWPLMVNRNQIDSGFLYGIVQSDPFIAAASISYGTHMPRADWNVMRNFKISLPEIQEQRAIASVLSDMDAEIAALEQRRDKTRAIKQGMMQQLLTGRVRLLKLDPSPSGDV